MEAYGDRVLNCRLALAKWKCSTVNEIRGLSPAIVPPLAAVSTISTAASTILFGPVFVDIQRSAGQVAPIQSGNGLFALAVVAHFHESKASSPSGVPVGNEVYAVNRAELLKHASNGTFGSIKTEVPYKNTSSEESVGIDTARGDGEVQFAY